MSKKYYLQIVFNHKDYYSSNNKISNIDKYCEYAKIKQGNAPKTQQQLSFYTIDLNNGWYKHCLKTSEIKFIQLKNNEQDLLEQEDLPLILTNYFKSQKNANNKVKFQKTTLLNIEKKDNQFVLNIENTITEKKLYGVVECTKGCTGFFNNNNLFCKSYEIMQLPNNIIEYLPLTFIKDDLNVYAIQYSGEFLKIKTNEEDVTTNEIHTNAYYIYSEGAYVQLYNNLIFEDYKEAQKHVPENQTYHNDYLLIKINDNMVDYQHYNIYENNNNNYLTNYKETKQYNVEQLGIFNIGKIYFQYGSYSQIGNGFYVIKNNNNIYYDFGKIQNNIKINKIDNIINYTDKENVINIEQFYVIKEPLYNYKRTFNYIETSTVDINYQIEIFDGQKYIYINLKQKSTPNLSQLYKKYYGTEIKITLLNQNKNDVEQSYKTNHTNVTKNKPFIECASMPLDYNNTNDKIVNNNVNNSSSNNGSFTISQNKEPNGISFFPKNIIQKTPVNLNKKNQLTYQKYTTGTVNGKYVICHDKLQWNQNIPFHVFSLQFDIIHDVHQTKTTSNSYSDPAWFPIHETGRKIYPDKRRVVFGFQYSKCKIIFCYNQFVLTLQFRNQIYNNGIIESANKHRLLRILNELEHLITHIDDIPDEMRDKINKTDVDKMYQYTKSTLNKIKDLNYNYYYESGVWGDSENFDWNLYHYFDDSSMVRIIDNNSRLVKKNYQKRYKRIIFDYCMDNKNNFLKQYNKIIQEFKKNVPSYYSDKLQFKNIKFFDAHSIYWNNQIGGLDEQKILDYLQLQIEQEGLFHNVLKKYKVPKKIKIRCDHNNESKTKINLEDLFSRQNCQIMPIENNDEYILVLKNKKSYKGFSFDVQDDYHNYVYNRGSNYYKTKKTDVIYNDISSYDIRHCGNGGVRTIIDLNLNNNIKISFALPQKIEKYYCSVFNKQNKTNELIQKKEIHTISKQDIVLDVSIIPKCICNETIKDDPFIFNFTQQNIKNFSESIQEKSENHKKKQTEIKLLNINNKNIFQYELNIEHNQYLNNNIQKIENLNDKKIYEICKNYFINKILNLQISKEQKKIYINLKEQNNVVKKIGQIGFQQKYEINGNENIDIKVSYQNQKTECLQMVNILYEFINMDKCESLSYHWLSNYDMTEKLSCNQNDQYNKIIQESISSKTIYDLISQKKISFKHNESNYLIQLTILNKNNDVTYFAKNVLNLWKKIKGIKKDNKTVLKQNFQMQVENINEEILYKTFYDDKLKTAVSELKFLTFDWQLTTEFFTAPDRCSQSIWMTHEIYYSLFLVKEGIHFGNHQTAMTGIYKGTPSISLVEKFLKEKIKNLNDLYYKERNNNNSKHFRLQKKQIIKDCQSHICNSTYGYSSSDDFFWQDAFISARSDSYRFKITPTDNSPTNINGMTLEMTYQKTQNGHTFTDENKTKTTIKKEQIDIKINEWIHIDRMLDESSVKVESLGKWIKYDDDYEGLYYPATPVNKLYYEHLLSLQDRGDYIPTSNIKKLVFKSKPYLINEIISFKIIKYF